ncbi:MAG: ABC transporter permease [archaeon]|jgi:putative ABC transport system permease protein
MQFDFDVLENSIKNLRRAGMRTVLTLIGVIIGIAAIVSLLSIGQGLNVAVEQQFQSLGSNTIFVIPGAAARGLAGVKLTDNDLTQLEGIRGVNAVVPIYGAAAILEYNGQKINIQVSAADAEKSSIFDSTGYFDVAEGRTFYKNDSSAVLIGDKIASTYFDRTITPRKIVLINGVPFTVIGIMKPQAQSFGGGPNTGTSVFMSLDAFNKIAKNISPSIIFVKTDSGSDVSYAVTEIKDYLDKKYGEKSVTVSSADDLLKQVNAILGVITLVIAGIGGISLIVGGIGIMNAMITAVLERTKEIGLMKALGAANQRILIMFILEAGFIGLIGGIIGVVIGYSLSALIALLGTSSGFALTAVMTPEITIGSLIFALIIGIVSGLLPAIRAANLDPVVALRYE